MGCAQAKRAQTGAVARSESAAERRLNDQIGDRLSAEQIALVRRTWARVSEDLAGAGAMVFIRLFETDKSMRSMFQKLLSRSGEGNAAKPTADYEPDAEKLEKHGEAVMQALGAAVDCLEDALMLNSVLLALGQAHCAFHVRPEHVMRLWPAIDYTMERKLGRMYTREAQKAWLNVYRYIAEKMALGIQMRLTDRSNGVDS